MDGHFFKYLKYCFFCILLFASLGGSGQNNFFRSHSAIVPSLSTTATSNITNVSATSGGVILHGGGGTVTARGVCWSTHPSPTLSDNKTSDGSGTGSYTSALSDLTAETTYYVRAYATNITGTAYGTEISFTTGLATLPVIITIPVTQATPGG
jgi:hypothetical protein